MAEPTTLSSDTVYCTKGNIVVPALELKTAAAVATAAQSRVQDTVPGVTAITLATPTKSPT